MNYRRALAIVAILFFLIFALFLFLFLSKKSSDVPIDQIGNDMPIFGSGGTATGTMSDRESNAGQQIDLTFATSSTLQGRFPELAACDSPISIERNECVKKIALEKRSTAVCGAILGTFGQTDCRSSIGAIPDKPLDISSRSLVTYDFRPSSTTWAEASRTNGAPAENTNTLSSKFDDIIERIRETVKDARENPDPRYSADGFFGRMAELPLALYSFTRFQASPGMELIAQGMGFTPEGNEIHIGEYTVAGLKSADGMKIAFTLPSSMNLGTYEAWVTNSRGTSKVPERPIQITITDNPLSPPTITGVQPAQPKISDTVTLTGTNLQGALGLYTSLGVLEKISASESSISFKMSDFELINKIKDIQGVKGNLISVHVVAGTPQGYNQVPFVFGVQF